VIASRLRWIRLLMRRRREGAEGERRSMEVSKRFGLWWW
jgi:hypothetical protein